MGAKKWTFEKMGVAHRFFFLRRPWSFFLFHGRRAHRAPIVFFFLKRPLFTKKYHGQVTNKFLFIFPLNRKIICPSDFWYDFFWQNLNFWWGAHCAPIVFFFPPIKLEKKSWAVRPSCAHEFFFFRPWSWYPYRLGSLFIHKKSKRISNCD